MTAPGVCSPSRSGSRSPRPGILTDPPSRPGTRFLSVLLVVSIIGVIAFASTPRADALAPPPLPPFPMIPPPAAGAVSVGAASTGVGGVATVAGAAGASIVLPPLVAAAGFVAGYQTASVLCGATNTFGGVCADYDPPSVPVSGLSASSAPCTFTYSGTLRSHYCETYSWLTLLDTGANLNNSVPIRLQLDPVSPVFTPDGVQIPDGASLAPGIGCWWGASQGLPTYPSQCGQSLNPNLAPPSRYGPGQVSWPREANPAPDGRLNGFLEPGDQIIIRVGNDSQVQGVVPASPEVNARGGEYRFKAYLNCKSGNNTNNYTRTGAWGSQANPPSWPDVTCPTGYPMALQVDWEQYRRVFTPRSGGWFEYGGAPLRSGLYVSWQAPTEMLTDTRLRTCYESEDCVLTETVQGDPSTCQWGGAPAPSAYCSTARAQLQESNPPPTTTIPTTAPPPTTTPPPTNPVPPDPQDPQFTFGTCLDDQLDGVGASVGLNPASWVPALLRYLVAPIICAVLWLVIPENGFGAVFEGLTGALTESELVAPVVSAVQSLQLSQCLPVNIPLSEPFQSINVDAGLCGNPVIGGVWAMLFAFGLFGLGKEAIDTIASFNRTQFLRRNGMQG